MEKWQDLQFNSNCILALSVTSNLSVYNINLKRFSVSASARINHSQVTESYILDLCIFSLCSKLTIATRNLTGYYFIQKICTHISYFGWGWTKKFRKMSKFLWLSLTQSIYMYISWTKQYPVKLVVKIVNYVFYETYWTGKTYMKTFQIWNSSKWPSYGWVWHWGWDRENS